MDGCISSNHIHIAYNIIEYNVFIYINVYIFILRM